MGLAAPAKLEISPQRVGSRPAAHNTEETAMNKKKWIFTGVAGVVGLGIVAGGAAATASTMNLQTTDGTAIPGGAITQRAGVLDVPTVNLRETTSSVTVVSVPSAANVDSAA